jgi:hypothetical protein
MVTGEAFDDRLDRLTDVVERLATRVEMLATNAGRELESEASTDPGTTVRDSR